MNRPLRLWFLKRLAEGPARPSDLKVEFDLRDCDVYRVLGRMTNRGQVFRTRTVRAGRWGGNVSCVYQLVR